MMAVASYVELVEHVGHEVEVVRYGNANAAVECVTCGAVIVDFDAADARPMVPMFSLVTFQGTAMPESTLCATHYRDEALVDLAFEQGRLSRLSYPGLDAWDGGGFHDTSENEAVACIVCGTRGDGTSELDDEDDA